MSLFIRFALFILRIAPTRLASVIASIYAGLLDTAIPRLRRTAMRNLAFAMPDAPASAITDGVFRSIGRVLLAFARFPDLSKANIHQWIRVEGLDNYCAAKRRGKGVLIATGHIGNWELSAFAHAILTEPMNIVVRPIDEPGINSLVEKRRQLSGNRIIPKKDAARGILRALGNNEAVGVLIDQNTSVQEGIFVDFFGRPACAGSAFARIANRTGAAVIPGYAVWSEEEGKHILYFEGEVEMTGDDEADTARIHARLEAVIRRYPDQWLWIHRRWKTRPAGSPPDTQTRP
ncbi:MAG: lysophospholipid acyltransferase family protein [Bryobacteraceae bacterium]|nr:lysophospholipid acyltransferase family protein [Bryobacteraceae bacterium]